MMETPQLKVKQWPLSKLLRYANNSRDHSGKQIDQIAKSIKEFGFVNPCLVDAKGVLIAGHGRVAGAQKLGMTTVPVIQLGHLTEVQARALRIADNSIALNAAWNETMLRIELTDLKLEGFPLELLAFEDLQLVTFMAGSPNFQPGTEDEQGRLDQLSPMPVRCPHCGGEFDARANGKG